MNLDILKTRNLCINEYLLKYIDKDLSLNDFLVFLYLLNDYSDTFDINIIAKSLNINLEMAMISLNNLIKRNMIEYKTTKDNNNKIIEKVSLDNFYKKIIEIEEEKNNKKKENNIYEIFQQELVRGLSPVEYEYINSWLDKGMSEDLIIGALKEAVLSGAKNFRYINNILYEWKKKGFVTMADVELNRRSRSVKEVVEDTNKENDLLNFDDEYDWLNDDEE